LADDALVNDARREFRGCRGHPSLGRQRDGRCQGHPRGDRGRRPLR
jgi:hypothetical protein